MFRRAEKTRPPTYLLLLMLGACSDPASESLPAESEAPQEEGTRAEETLERAAESPAVEEAAAAPSHPYQCRVPPIPIPRSPACVRGRDYPDCKWQLPWAPLADGRYRRWRNTIVEHHWARPSLVSTILATADDFHRAFPEQPLAIGDLDAPGPRHQTHRNGVNVDIYLLGAMRVENAGAGRYPNNYEGKTAEEVQALQNRVLELAKIWAACTNGAVQIYYNDPEVIAPFLAWYEEMGFPDSPLGAPMEAHNDLHEFHFHITIPEDLALLEREPLPEGEADPVMRIQPPPRPGSAPHLSSMNRRPGDWAPVPRE